MPTNASGPARESPLCTAPTRTPIAMANVAGSAPRSRRASHHASARPGAAFNRTLKNFHSLRSLTRWNMPAILPQKTCLCTMLRKEFAGAARNLSWAKAARAAGLVSPSASAFNMRLALTPSRSETRPDNLIWASSIDVARHRAQSSASILGLRVFHQPFGIDEILLSPASSAIG